MDDNNKDVHDNKNDEYEKYCYLCRRPESQVGKLIYLPNNINICQDCMLKPYLTNELDTNILLYHNQEPNFQHF